jgi:hypothetical protein
VQADNIKVFKVAAEEIHCSVFGSSSAQDELALLVHASVLSR